MAPMVFPDNSVLCNFAAVKRMALVEGWLRGRGRWTAAIAYEVRRSADYLPALREVMEGGWLGEAIDIENVDAVEHLRQDVFGGLPEEPLKHLGEAETCWLLREPYTRIRGG